MMVPAAQISQAPVVQCGADVPSAKSSTTSAAPSPAPSPASPPASCKGDRRPAGSKAEHHQTQDERPSPIVVIPSPIGGLAEPASHGPQPNNVSPSIEPPVQNYVDTVPYLWTPGPLFSLPDVAQVSMTQAAGGSDYMRGAPDGTLQVVTRTPPRAFTADVSATYGNYGTVGTSGYVAGALTSNLTASLAGQYHQQFDGFGTNLYNGKDVQDGWNVATRGKLHWTPGPDTTVDLEADYYRFRAGNPAIRNTGLSLLGTTAPGGAYDVDSEIQPDIQSRYGGASLVIRQALGGMDLTSTSAYREGRLAVAIDADTTEQDILSIEQHQMLRQASQDLKLSSQAGSPVSWALGLSYLHSTSGYDPVIASGAFFAGPNTLYATSKLNSYAAYGHVSAPLSPTTTARIGLRYTIDSRAISQSQTETVGDVVSYVDAPQSEAHTFHGLTGDIGVEQRLSSVLSGYVTYDHAQQSGTLLPNTFPALTIKPETLDAFRAGLKAVAGRGAFVANLSAFLNDYTNMQAMQRVEGLTYILSAPKARSYGLEGTLFARVSPRLTVNGGLTWTHARYIRFPEALISTPLATGGNSVVTGDASGNDIQDVPAFTMTLGARYDLPTRWGTFSLGATNYYNSGYASEPDNRLRQPRYDVLDASLTWTSKDHRLSAQLWANNITNTFYVAELTALPVGDNQVAAPPRTFGLTIGYHFGGTDNAR